MIKQDISLHLSIPSRLSSLNTSLITTSRVVCYMMDCVYLPIVELSELTVSIYDSNERVAGDYQSCILIMVRYSYFLPVMWGMIL